MASSNTDAVKPKAKKRKRLVAVGLQRAATRAKKLGGITGNGFKPGQSGNPSGRRAGSVSLMAALKRAVTRLDADSSVAPALGLIEPFSGKVYAVSGGGVLRVQQNVKIFIDTLWHFIKLSVAKWCKLPRDAATTNENENK